MKKFILTLVTISSIALFATGCKTPVNPVTTAMLTIAADVGTTTYLTQNPSARPDFVAADVALVALGTTNGVTVAQIEAALSTAQLGANSVPVSIAVADLIPLIEGLVQQGAANQTGANTLAILNAVRTGLEQGLAASDPVAVKLKAAKKLQ